MHTSRRPLALWDVQNVVGRPPVGGGDAVRGPRAPRRDAPRAPPPRRRDRVHHSRRRAVRDGRSRDRRAPPAARALRGRARPRRAPCTARRRGAAGSSPSARASCVRSSRRRASSGGSGGSGEGSLRGVAGVTELLLGPTTRRAVVDAVLTGVHESDTTHFTLLERLRRSRDARRRPRQRRARGLLGHEFGDAWLVWGHVVRRRPSHSASAAADALLRRASPAATVAA